MTDVIDPVEALRKVRAALFTDRPDEIAPLNAQAVVCTLWANHLITLRDFLDAEITAAEAAGMVWVPKVPTEAMCLAALHSEHRTGGLTFGQDVYAAMLSARPSLTDPNQARDGED